MNTVYEVSVDDQTGVMKQSPIGVANAIGHTQECFTGVLSEPVLRKLRELVERHGAGHPEFADTIADEVRSHTVH